MSGRRGRRRAGAPSASPRTGSKSRRAPGVDRGTQSDRNDSHASDQGTSRGVQALQLQQTVGNHATVTALTSGGDNRPGGAGTGQTLVQRDVVLEGGEKRGDEPKPQFATSPLPVEAVTGGWDLAFARQHLDEYLKAGYHVVGADEAQTIALAQHLYRRSKEEHFGQEFRTVAPLGPKPEDGEAPIGRVLIGYTKAGYGYAKVIAGGAQPAAQTAVDDREVLGRFFQEGIQGDWDDEDLAKVRMAVDLVPAQDREALQSASLVYQESLSAKETGDDDLHTRAYFSYQHPGVSKGEMDFEPSRRLIVSKLAFSLDETGFAGGGEATHFPSVRTIVHEIAHAVETDAHQAARRREPAARVEAQRSDEAWAEEGADTNWEPYQRLLGDSKAWDDNAGGIMTALMNDYNSQDNADTQSTAEAQLAVDAPRVAVQEWQDFVDAAQGFLNNIKTAEVNDYYAVKAKREAFSKALHAANTKLGAEYKTAHAALTSFLNAKAYDESLYQKAVGACAPEAFDPEGLLGAGATDIFRRRLEARKALKQAEKSVESVSGDERSNRLHNFVTFVEEKEIDPAITAYAGESWAKGNPAEFFAEAYSLWRTDREYLVSYSNDLFQYFEGGLHRRDEVGS